MQSILTRNANYNEDQIKIEADVIVTATVLGFIGTRYHQAQPCSFDIEHPDPSDLQQWQQRAQQVNQTLEEQREYLEYIEDTQVFVDVLESMSIVLRKTDEAVGDHLKDSQSPEWKPGALITGLRGGERTQFSERHQQIESEEARRFAVGVEENPRVYDIYQGRGAYTGMINDPVNDNWLVRPTRRVIDQDNNRWYPGVLPPGRIWGLIGQTNQSLNFINLDSNPSQGMGPLPRTLNDNERIGYIHGMSSAICECIKHGPWCTPFEMAIGEQTTKMASCFACCTYMYAAGYPPSSMHLGRGESWVPPSLNTHANGEIGIDIRTEFDNQIVSSLLTKWHREVFRYMTLGVRYLLRAMTVRAENMLGNIDYGNFHGQDFVNRDHHTAVHNLHQALLSLSQTDQENPQANVISSQGGNLFLDALTIHESDWKRISETLKPTFRRFLGYSILEQRRLEEQVNQMSLSKGFSSSPRSTTLPEIAASTEPVLLNGMKVTFDKSASVFPVNLTKD
jgi:hypothetical protein